MAAFGFVEGRLQGTWCMGRRNIGLSRSEGGDSTLGFGSSVERGLTHGRDSQGGFVVRHIYKVSHHIMDLCLLLGRGLVQVWHHWDLAGKVDVDTSTIIVKVARASCCIERLLLSFRLVSVQTWVFDRLTRANCWLTHTYTVIFFALFAAIWALCRILTSWLHF